MSKRFLYLEDDEILAGVTVRALAARDYQVEHFASVAAVENCSHIASFTFALLDLKLEDGNSLSLIERLITSNPALKIVVLTGYASLATAVQAVKLGAVNYLAKPASIDDILQAFTEVAMPAPELDEPTEMSLRRREWETIQAALTANGGNISATARQLKMHRRTLQRKLHKRPVSE